MRLRSLPCQLSPRTRSRAATARACLAGLVPMLFALTASAGPSGSAGSSGSTDAPVLVLSHEHLGMTKAQIEASQAAVAPEPSAMSSAPSVGPGSEFRDRPGARGDADALEAEAEAAQQRARRAAERAEAAAWAVEAAEAGLVPGIGGNREGPAGFESCMESLIRHGDSYAKSDRTCRAIFEAADAVR